MRAITAAALATLSMAGCGGGGAGSGAAPAAATPAAAVTVAGTGPDASTGPNAASAVAVPPPPRTIEFSGYTWNVKDTGTSQFGPGPNSWSGDASTVWVDPQGLLHLKVWQEAGVWKCAEVYLTQTLGYGTYSFKVQGDVADLDPNLVLGLFVYSNAAADNHREIDIELSRWGVAGASSNGGYTVQPSSTTGNSYAWTQPGGLALSTQAFQWSSGQVDFTSSVPGSPPYAAFSLAGAAVPDSLDEVVHMNLWLYGGLAPSDGRPAEVVIESFAFAPG